MRRTSTRNYRQWGYIGFNGGGSDTSRVPHGEPYAGKLHVRLDEGAGVPHGAPRSTLHPGTGRWLSKDPIRVVGDMNLYSFVLNKPINCNDFDGMDIHYTSEGGGHSVIWVDKPGSDGNRTISFEFGPLSGNIFWGESVVITSEECGHHGSKTIKTTVEQDEKAIQKINVIKNKKPKYNVLFNNCADLVRDILDAAGIDLPWRLIDTPTKLENDLKNK